MTSSKRKRPSGRLASSLKSPIIHASVHFPATFRKRRSSVTTAAIASHFTPAEQVCALPTNKHPVKPQTFIGFSCVTIRAQHESKQASAQLGTNIRNTLKCIYRFFISKLHHSNALSLSLRLVWFVSYWDYT